MKSEEALTYDDVLLTPRYSEIRSREEINIGNALDDHIWLNVPVISSPMDTVTEGEMAHVMASHGGLGIVHRYNEIDEQAGIVRELYDAIKKLNPMVDPPVAAAIGVTERYFTRAAALYENGANILCVDVAHGHHVLVKEAIKRLKVELGKDIHIMAGNVATLEAFNDLADWGADSVRCNIGGGSICSTRIQTGHGRPGLQTIFDCARTDRDVKIIADGGIRTSGDIVKALAAGADFVMVGSMLAGTAETPGSTYEDAQGRVFKKYRGMASKDAQMKWRGQYSSDEGVSTQVPYKGPASATLEDLIRGIRSGFSYSGARDILELHTKAQFVRQTSAGLNESGTHILSR
jgi:IMP dehydrogenase